MFIARVYGIEFVGQTENEVYDLVYEDQELPSNYAAIVVEEVE